MQMNKKRIVSFILALDLLIAFIGGIFLSKNFILGVLLIGIAISIGFWKWKYSDKLKVDNGEDKQ